MADVLSQSQIDALLKSMNSGGGDEPKEEKTEKVVQKEKAVTEEIKYSKYDFYSPRKFTKDKMKILTSGLEK